MKKKQTVGLLLAAVMCLVGCSNIAMKTDTLSLSKDGTATYTIITDFSKDYYDLEELMVMAREEVTDYGSGVQIIESVVEEGMLRFQYGFDSLLHYAEFMDTTCYQGTVSEALKTGYKADAQLVLTKGGAVVLMKDKAIQDNHIFIWSEDVAVKFNDNILCYSDNLELNGKNGAIPKEETTGPYYVVYK